MTYSSVGKYRGVSGTLTVGGGKLVFTRMDGLIFKKERIMLTIQVDAIVDMNVEGLIFKKLIILVDGTKIPGIPRHEFKVSDPYRGLDAIRKEIASWNEKKEHRDPSQIESVHVKEILREIVKVPCNYCRTLNEITDKKCSGCGAPIGRG